MRFDETQRLVDLGRRHAHWRRAMYARERGDAELAAIEEDAYVALDCYFDARKAHLEAQRALLSKRTLLAVQGAMFVVCGVVAAASSFRLAWLLWVAP